MNVLTAGTLERELGVQIDPHLERDLTIPTISGKAQRQGDVLFLPSTKGEVATTPLTPAGFPVVRGENGGNTHSLHLGDGKAYFDPDTTEGLRLGLLTVEENSTAILAHPEHGFMCFGKGTYVATRQREQADEIRMVLD